MRLFRDQGYDETTVEEIAAAAEVSPSTFFRYFPTKEDVVLRDDYDTLMMEVFLAQPSGLTPLRAARSAIHTMAEIFANLSRDELELEQIRIALTFSVPDVRARWMEEFARAFGKFAEGVASRAGLTPDDLRVRTFVGALLGVMVVAFEPLARDPSADWMDILPTLDEALGYLEAGLPL